MAKKIVLLVFTVITLGGIALTLTGFALGGRTGGLQVGDGKVAYRTTDGKEKVLGNVPAGWNFTVFGHSYTWDDNGKWDGWDDDYDHDYDHDYDYDYDPPEPPEPPEAPEAPEAPEPPAAPTAPGRTATSFADANIIDLDIGAGYVTIKTGSEASLVVDGPLEYTSKMEEGVWKIKSKHNLDGIRTSTEIWKDRPRFFRNGKDVTTTYTLTLPATATHLETELGMGSMEIEGLTLTEGDFTIDMGELKVKDCTIEDASYSADMGAVDVTGHNGRLCELETNMGAIKFSGNVTEWMEADCTMGSIKADLPRPERYGWKAETSLGSIDIDGKGAAGLSSGSSGENNGEGPFFELKCDMGSIEVKFT